MQLEEDEATDILFLDRTEFSAQIAAARAHDCEIVMAEPHTLLRRHRSPARNTKKI